jgi:hypothetical protein
LLLLQLTTYNKSFAEKGERGERDKGNKNRGRGMEIHKPREKKKGISERGNNIARLGSVLHETSGREKGKRKAETEMKKKQTTAGETEITVEEVERQIRKLKKRKAPGRDGVQNEAWSMGLKE